MLPSYLTPFVSITALLVVVALAWLISFGTLAATAPMTASPRSAAGPLTLGLFAWLAVAFGLGLGGAYHVAPNSIPTIEFGISLPILLGVGLYLTVPAVRDLVMRLPHGWLIGLQFYRAGGAIFIVLWSLGLLPGVFGLPAGIGDILIGVTAPIVAFVYLRSGRKARVTVLAWNLLGLLDLIIALTGGFLTTPSRFQLFALDAPNLLVTQFPLVIIPTFIVPLSILLHLASLAKLEAERRA
jgi:hypothetical protein